MHKEEFKIGDVIKVVHETLPDGFSVSNDLCKDFIGEIGYIRKVASKGAEYPYEVEFLRDKVNVYNEEEVKLVTKEEAERFWLMRYRD